MAAKPMCRPLVVAGPSGSGKSTLIKRLFQEFPNEIDFSVSRKQNILLLLRVLLNCCYVSISWFSVLITIETKELSIFVCCIL